MNAENKHNIRILVADASHEKYVDEILDTIREAAKRRGTGIAERTHEYVATKMKEGKAVIALDENDKFGGFSYIETWGNKQYVTTSGLIVHPDYQGLGIGWEIVKNLGEDIQRDGLNPFLHTHPGAVGFYNHEGFLRNKTALDYRNDEELSHPMPAEMETGFYLPKGYRFIDEINM